MCYINWQYYILKDKASGLSPLKTLAVSTSSWMSIIDLWHFIYTFFLLLYNKTKHIWNISYKNSNTSVIQQYERVKMELKICILHIKTRGRNSSKKTKRGSSGWSWQKTKDCPHFPWYADTEKVAIYKKFFRRLMS